MSTLLDDSLWREVEDHVLSDVDREVGGVLLGRMEDEVTAVTAVIPALAAVGGSANVTFTQEVWEDVHRQIDEQYPESQIVGWYHSHPGFGIFLSGYDRFIHENFFPSAGHLALVVDPLAGEAGWFGWRDGELVELNRVEARTAATNHHPARSAQGDRQPRRNAALLAVPLVAVAGFIAGHLVSGTEPAADVPAVDAQPTDETRADEDVGGSEAELAAERLEAELAAERERNERLESDMRVLEQDSSTDRPAASNDADLIITYTVGSGDTLWRIADRVYGEGEAWRLIAGANPDIDPEDLAIGARLRVPIPPDRISDPEASSTSAEDSS